MDATHLLVPTDFSSAANHALRNAVRIAQSASLEISLFHVFSKDSKKLMLNAGLKYNHPQEAMDAIATEIKESQGFVINTVLNDGAVLEEINREARDPKYQMIIIGTHGTRGLRQTLFGADMLRLAKDASISILCVSEDSAETLLGTSIVIPYGAHSDYKTLVNSTAFVAKHTGTKVYLFGVRRLGDRISEQTRTNAKEAMRLLHEKGVDVEEVFRESTDFSVGFSHEVLKFSQEVNASFVSIMNKGSEEHAYISKADKERLLNNEYGIGLLISPI